MDRHVGLLRVIKLLHGYEFLSSILNKLIHWGHLHLLLHKHLLLHHHWIHLQLLLLLLLLDLSSTLLSRLLILRARVASRAVLLLLHLERHLLLHQAHVLRRLRNVLELLGISTIWYLHVRISWLTKYLLVVKPCIWVHHASKLLGQTL